MRTHTTRTRDAALRELRRLDRWLIAGSIALTGMLADVAANAFPGKTIKASTSKPKAASGQSSGSSAKSSQPLKPPAAAPEASQESSPSRETRESAPPQESAPAPEASMEATPSPEPSAPVVSGGS
jgi:hypothetical protein